MAAKKKARKTPSKSRTKARTKAPDAIALLKQDHQQVKTWFEQFEKSRSEDKKASLASQICHALKVHTEIEEEIFYPAFLQAAHDEDIHHEAVIEHDGAKKLIEEIEEKGPGDDYFDARVTVLSEMIRHHVKEEEQAGGMFAKARAADMDLVALGAQMKQRKDELDASV